jgi:hypothetical protein
LEKDENAVTARLQALAPTYAKLPRWTRNLSDTQLKWMGRAAWTVITLLGIAASGLFWRTVTIGTMQKASADQATKIEQLVKDMAVVKTNTSELKKWHDGLVCEAERDWSIRHGKHPAPCVPAPEAEP